MLDLSEREKIASTWTRQGIDYLNRSPDVSVSIPWFEAAIQLRSRFPLEQNPWYRYGLAAGWMNRGAALFQIGGEVNLKESIQCFDHALDQLQHLPVEERPEFRHRHVVAWINRGLALLQQSKKSTEALRSFQKANSLLTSEIPEFPLLKIGIEVNLATAQFQVDDDPFKAENAARNILSAIEPHESSDPQIAEIGLKARHLLCLSIGYQADSSRHTSKISPDRISEITDILETGIHLALNWKNKNHPQFIPLAQTLFCFGLQFYRAYLPQFLGEFIEEFLHEDSSSRLPRNPDVDLLVYESLLLAEAALHHQTSKDILSSKDHATTDSLIERYHDLTMTRKRFESTLKVSA